jgi:hypothetical protein
MDPYLEHPSLWPDVHNSLITAIRDALTPLVAPRYYIGLERRTYLLKPDDVVFVGRPDVAVVAHRTTPKPALLPLAEAGVLEVEVPMTDEVSENFLEIREVHTGRLVTILELLSPVNKLNDEGRQQYLQKRSHILLSQTNLVEVDLLRAGNPMPVVGQPVVSDYRILVSRAWQRPRAQLYPFNLQQPIPLFPLPLLRQDDPPEVGLGAILQALYERARFDLRLDYTQPPVPPLGEADAAWAKELISGSR